MIEAPYLETSMVLRAAVTGEISPREAEWGLLDVLNAAGQDIDPDAADLIDTALVLLGEWDRGDRPVEDLLAEFDRLATRQSANGDGRPSDARVPATRLTRSS